MCARAWWRPPNTNRWGPVRTVIAHRVPRIKAIPWTSNGCHKPPPKLARTFCFHPWIITKEPPPTAKSWSQPKMVITLLELEAIKCTFNSANGYGLVEPTSSTCFWSITGFNGIWSVLLLFRKRMVKWPNEAEKHEYFGVVFFMNLLYMYLAIHLVFGRWPG